MRRHHPGGALDASFGREGMLDFDPEASDLQLQHVALGADLEVALSGYGTILTTYPVLLRLTAAGERDPDFAQGASAAFPSLGSAHGSAGPPLLLPDRSILVTENAPDAVRLVRFDERGVLDLGFGDAGVIVIDGASALAPPLLAHARASILLAWQAPDGALVVQRRDRSGALDPSFADGGTASLALDDVGTAKPQAIVVLEDGAVLVAATLRGAGACESCSTFAILRIVG